MTPIPRPEHPRPDFEREQWLNLNGVWQFAFDPRAIGEQMRWYLPGQINDLTINVPFPWESRLSGVTAPAYKGAGWYERQFTMPAEWEGLAPHLHFEAVDWCARVWVNGRLVAEHENGYLPFAIDLSRHVRPGQTATVTVRAYDIAEATTLLGKQVPHWYTHTSGIWQTVWLEGRAPSHITSLRISPDVQGQRATVQVQLNIAEDGHYWLRLHSPDGAFPALEKHNEFWAGAHQTTIELPIPDPQLWSPESPHLYDLVAELEPAGGGVVDRVKSYFGMRSVGRAKWAGKDYEYILLNDEPVYLRGALDQAFHPDGIHTYPSDEVIRGDIQLARDLGLNMLRCHIKINEPRYYYWADRLGLLIMYDFPSPDLESPQMRRTFETALHQAIARDFNHPSIFAWVLFNETWGLSNHDTPEGQRWLQRMVHLARQLDPTRLVEDNSPCRFDHVETDINSWHFYINNYEEVRWHIQRVVEETYPGSAFNFVGGEFVQHGEPLMNSEYGGIAAHMGDQDVAWCFKYQTTELRRHPKICGYVYTELDDIEWEHNGFVNYDRSRKEFGYDYFVPGMRVADLNAADLVGFDAPPCQTLSPGDTFRAPVFVSHWGPAMARCRVRWQLDLLDRFGKRRKVTDGHWEMQPHRFHVTSVGPLEVSLPAENGLATLALWLEDEAGHVRCRNYVNVEVRDGATPRVEEIPGGWVLRFAPGAIHKTSWVWPRPVLHPGGAKFAAQGSGWVEYELSLPDEVDLQRVGRLRLRFEAGARAGFAKVDWPQKLNGFNYPQTEENKKYPTDLMLSINGVTIGTTRLPDDPADARGVLSHHHGVDPGSYGYLTEVTAEGEALAAVRQALAGAPLRVRFEVPAQAPYPGGLALYGETLGCYPLDPTLVLEMG